MRGIRFAALIGGVAVVATLSGCSPAHTGLLGIVRQPDESLIAVVEMCQGSIDRLSFSGPYLDDDESPTPRESIDIPVTVGDYATVDDVDLREFYPPAEGEFHLSAWSTTDASWALGPYFTVTELDAMTTGDVLYFGRGGSQVGTLEEFQDHACS